MADQFSSTSTAHYDNLTVQKFTILEKWTGDLNVDGEFSAKLDGLFYNNLTVGNTFNVKGDTIAEQDLTVKGVFLVDTVFFKNGSTIYGSALSTNIVIDVAKVDISSNVEQVLDAHTTNPDIRNIIARNNTNGGIAVSATGTTEAAIQFYCGNSILDTSAGSANAIISFNHADNLLLIDSKGDTKLTSNLIISDNRDVSNTRTSYNETLLIYDNSGSTAPFFPDAYQVDCSYGNAVTLVTIDESAKTFLNIATQNKYGLQIGGGTFPNDTTRSMGIIDVFNSYQDKTKTPTLDPQATPAMMIVSGNTLTKYNATTGFNTFSPKYNDYAVDINGPVHINNGEVKITHRPQTGINVMRNIGSTLGLAVGSFENETGAYNNNKYYIYKTEDGGQTWNKSIRFTDGTIDILQASFTSMSIYDTSFAVICAKNTPYAFYTDNGGTWKILSSGGENSTVFLKTPSIVYIGSPEKIRYGTIEYDSQSTGWKVHVPMADESIPGFVIQCCDGSLNTIAFASSDQIRLYDTSNNGLIDLSANHTYTNANYRAVRVYNTNYLIGVGDNIITYTNDRGINWYDIPIDDASLNDVFIFDASNAVAVGSKGRMYVSSDGSQTWRKIDADTVNASGVGNTVINDNVNFTSIFTPDLSTFVISAVDVSENKIFYLNMPNIFNNSSNFLMDISGSIRMTGGLNIDGNILSTGNMDISGQLTVDSSGSLWIRNEEMSTSKTTGAMKIGGGVGIMKNMVIGGNVVLENPEDIRLLTDPDDPTKQFIYDSSGALQINGGVFANKSMMINQNLHVRGNLYLNGGLVSDNSVVATPDVPWDANSPNDIEEGNPCIRAFGGILVEKRLQIKNSTNEPVALDVSGGTVVKGDLVVNAMTDATTKTSGALRIKGGVGIGGTLCVDKIQLGSGETVGFLTNAGTYGGNDPSFNTGVVPILNRTLATENPASGAFLVKGGIRAWRNLHVGAFAGSPDPDAESVFYNTTDASSTTQGSLQIRGGVGVTKNIYVGQGITAAGPTSTSRIWSTVPSTTSSDGALVVNGGVGIGQNVNIGGTLIVTSTTGTSKILSGENSSTITTGALVVNGGVGIGQNVYIGGRTKIYDIEESSSTTNGALTVVGGVGIGKNINVGTGISVFNDASSNPIDISGNALQVIGGVGIVKDCVIGRSCKINGSADSGNTTSGALVVSGGVGIGQNVNIGGTLNVTGTSKILSGENSSTTTNGALVVAGGIGIGKNINVGPGISVFTDVSSSITDISSNALQVKGGVGISKDCFISGNCKITGNVESGNTTSGTLTVTGGVGVSGRLSTNSLNGVSGVFQNSLSVGNMLMVDNSARTLSLGTNMIVVNDSINSLSLGGTIIMQERQPAVNSNPLNPTGALTVQGGIGVWGRLIIGNTSISTSATNGALVVEGGVGIGQNVNIGGTLNVTGTITGGAINANSLSTIVPGVQGNITGGNIYAKGNLTTDGTIYATGNLTVNPGNITTTGNVKGLNITATGAMTGASLNCTGEITSTGTIRGATLTTANQYTGVYGDIQCGNIYINNTLHTYDYITGAGLGIYAGNITAGGLGGNISATKKINAPSITASTNLNLTYDSLYRTFSIASPSPNILNFSVTEFDGDVVTPISFTTENLLSTMNIRNYDCDIRSTNTNYIRAGNALLTSGQNTLEANENIITGNINRLTVKSNILTATLGSNQANLLSATGTDGGNLLSATGTNGGNGLSTSTGWNTIVAQSTTVGGNRISGRVNQIQVDSVDKIYIDASYTQITNTNSLITIVNGVERSRFSSALNRISFNTFTTTDVVAKRWTLSDFGQPTTIYLTQGITMTSTGVRIIDNGTSWGANSDRRIKKNIEPVKSALDDVVSLNPVFYNFKSDEDTYHKRVGFIAQELQEVYPDLVNDDGTTIGDVKNVLGIETTHLIPYLVKAIQELKTQLDAQSVIINDLVRRVETSPPL